jgi:hypothetical protein
MAQMSGQLADAVRLVIAASDEAGFRRNIGWQAPDRVVVSHVTDAKKRHSGPVAHLREAAADVRQAGAPIVNEDVVPAVVIGSSALHPAGHARRRPHVAWSSGRPWFCRYIGEQPLFEQAGCYPMCLQMGGVDHGLVRLSTFGSPACENADEPVIDGLGRAMCRQRRPLWITKMTHRSSTLGTPKDNGKCGSIRRI